MGRILVLVLVVTTAAALSPTFAWGARLSVVPSGEPGVAVTVRAAGVTQPPCTAVPIRMTACTYDEPLGEMVTLTATPDGFAGWSDVRCAPVPTCTVSLDEASTTIAASYAAQHLWVRIAGAGTVAPAGRGPCVVDPNDPTTADCGLFPLGSRVTLAAAPRNPTPPRWERALSNPERPLCDDPPGASAARDPTCAIDVNGLRWGNVAFDDQTFSSAVPASVEVSFHVLKVGSGAGTIRSGSLDCGGRCTAQRLFGNRERLVALPRSGSRFVRWRGACGTAPTCSLAIGPVTAISAEFRSRGRAPATPRGRRLVARLGRVSVRGRGRRRSVVASVRVSAAASVRAVLRRGRRTVVARSRRVDAGRSSAITLRVPARTRRGTYVLRLTARDRAGRTAAATRRVRVPS